MCSQSFLNFERVYVFAAYQMPDLEIAINFHVGVKLTTNNDVLEATGDSAVPFGVKGSFVTSLQPFDTLGIGYKCLCRLLRIMPVSLGKLVAGHAKLTTLTNGNDVSLCIDNFRASVGQNLSDGGQSCVDAVRGESIKASRRGLRET